MARDLPLVEGARFEGAGYRSAADGAHVFLRAFERDLRNLGLTEEQIHEIIPDAWPRGRRRADQPPTGEAPAAAPPSNEEGTAG